MMRRSKRSSAPTTKQPEFFLDRGLGRGVAEDLAERGWILHRITDHFPNDAQDVSDEAWIEYGLVRGWVPLCKDGRIRGREHEREPLERFRAVLFYLDNQRLRRADMVQRFDQARFKIERRTRRSGPAIYAVRADGKVDKVWP